MRSEEKAAKIREAHSGVPTSQLDFAIVEDIAIEGAFDAAVVSNPPFDAVIHTASPFHFNVTDIQKQLLDPAIIGTTSILRSIKAHAPSVKRVVVTSSFASIYQPARGLAPGYVYSEADWSGISHAEALKDNSSGYRGSKTLAEQAAWKFVETEKPNFTLATVNPPLVLGPVIHYLNSLDALNTSNQRTGNIISGKFRDEISETGTFLWVDVRDVALAHVKAVELPKAAGKRFFTTAGYFSNREIADIVRKNFPQLGAKLPKDDAKGGDYPPGGKEAIYGYDNSRSKEVLGLQYRSLEESIVDTVKSLLAVSG